MGSKREKENEHEENGKCDVINTRLPEHLIGSCNIVRIESVCLTL